MSFHGRVSRLVAPCAGLVLSGLAAGCTFPGVTFGDVSDGGGTAVPHTDATTPDVMGFGDDDGPAADVSTSVGASDAGAALDFDGGCNFNGTWATRITIDVTWAPQGLNAVILKSGSGTITQWVRSIRKQTPEAPTALIDNTAVCGIQLPDFQSTTTEVYGIRFPDTLFDDGYIPPFTVSGALNPMGDAGMGYSTTETAVLLGLTMTNPTQDPWPATITAMMADDQEHDNKPGVTVPVQGPLANPSPTSPDYQYIPTDIPPLLLEQPVRASALYLAIRQVTITSGTVVDCNTITGTVDIPVINSKPAIDSHILGCALVDGGDCTVGSSSETSFLDNTQPVFTPSTTGTTTFQSIRLKADAGTATCADVRNAPFH
jgi:hypothetical protein